MSEDSPLVSGKAPDLYQLPRTAAQWRAIERTRYTHTRTRPGIPAIEKFEGDVKKKDAGQSVLKVVDLIRARTWASEAAFAEFMGQDVR